MLCETLLPKAPASAHVACRGEVEVIEALEEGEEVQLKVDDRPEAGLRFPLKQLPLCVTVAQLGGKFLMDVTAEEELCADAMLCVVVDGKTGDIIGLHKRLTPSCTICHKLYYKVNKIIYMYDICRCNK